MQEEERHSLIEQYLNGTLSAEEKTSFEKAVSSDPALAEDLELSRLAGEVAFEQRLLNVRDLITQDMNKPSGGSSWKILALTAALITAGLTLYMVNREESPSVASVSAKIVTQPAGTTVPKNTLSDTTSPPAAKQNLLVPKVASVKGNGQQENSSQKEEQIVTVRTDLPVDSVKRNQTDPFIQNVPAIRNDKPCEATVITARAVSKASCEQQATGSIQVLLSSIKGGEAPYSFSIDEHAFASASVFENLKAGKHTIQIRDQNECILILQEQIPAVRCVREREDVSFNPDRGQVWTFENEENADAQIVILDKSGLTVNTFTVAAGQRLEWRGSMNNGPDLPLGTYICMITYKNNITEKGYITILR